VDFLREIEFDLVGVFAYSSQPGTPAAELADHVPEDLKGDRLIEVVGLQDKISQAKMQTLIGRTLRVLIEAKTAAVAIARSQYDMAEIDRKIQMDCCPAEPGDFTWACIHSISEPYHFLATPP
jgi:ribosomal protein S12 methylthiotransferase